jgi:hypothetical protein
MKEITTFMDLGGDTGTKGTSTRGICICLAVCFSPSPPLVRVLVAAVVEAGLFDVVCDSMRKHPLDSVELYMNVVCAGYFLPTAMADERLKTMLFSSGFFDAVVSCVQRGQASAIQPHVSANRGLGMIGVAMASTAEGRAKLLSTPGME